MRTRINIEANLIASIEISTNQPQEAPATLFLRFERLGKRQSRTYPEPSRFFLCGMEPAFTLAEPGLN